MRFSLSLNVGETPRDIASKGTMAEKLGFDMIWVGDLPTEPYAPAMASFLAEKTKSIKIGLGLISPLLYRPTHIASMIVTLVESYGPRFELCIGPGDRNRLNQAGIRIPKEIVESIMSASRTIREKLKRYDTQVKLWLGAQGPQMIEASTTFNGVLLNLPSPRMVQWASKIVQEKKPNEEFRIGVFTVSYVYDKAKQDIYNRALQAATMVALGASNKFLEAFGYNNMIKEYQHRIKDAGKSPPQTLLPEDILKEFSVIKDRREFKSYLYALERLGVKDLVLAYPQNHSLSTIKSLGKAINRYKES